MKQNYLLIPILLALIPLQAQAAIIFSHDFSSGDTNDLNGTGTTIGEATWVATAIFDKNGNVNKTDLLDTTNVNSGAGSATLAFAPSHGNIYTAEGSVSTIATSDLIWGAFGFANGQSDAQSTANRFTPGTPLTEGRAWMTFREDNNRTFLTGTNGNEAWSGLTSNPSNLDLKIVLDTTGGTGAWTATWFAKESTSSSFTEVRGSTIIAESITSVGFSASGDEITYSINSFSLTAVPEPSTYAAIVGLLGLGFVMIRRRRP